MIVQIGGMATKTQPLTLTWNLICLSIGTSTLIWGFVIKFIPLKFFQCISIDEKPMEEEEAASKITAVFKKSSTMKSSLSGSRARAKLGSAVKKIKMVNAFKVTKSDD